MTTEMTDDSTMKLESLDITAERLAALKDLFPEVFTEGKIDFDKLRLALGDQIETGKERYGLTWAGKAEAMRAVQILSTASLVPVYEQSVEWDTTQNVFIEGENLEVLKLLQKSYQSKAKVIYIDPPYNTGNEFIYPDNYRDSIGNYLRLTGQISAEGLKITTNTETIGRYHSNWLNMMYPRLFLARNLLREDGVIFVSIDDHEVENLRCVMNEIFGEENFVGIIIWKGATDNNPTRIAVEHEYLVCFAKQLTLVPGVWRNRSTAAKESMLTEYNRLRSIHLDSIDLIQKEFRRFIKANAESLSPLTHYSLVDEDGPYTGSRKVHNPKPGGYKYDVLHKTTGKICVPPANGYRFPPETMENLLKTEKILFGDDETQIIQIKEYLKDFDGKLSSVVALDSRTGSNSLESLFQERKVFTNPKPVELLSDILDFYLDDESLIIDFFAGSGTLAQAVFEMNKRDEGKRKFLLVQLPEPVESGSYKTIAHICRERIRRAGQNAVSQQELLEPRPQPDLGFRSFRLTTSNFKTWNADYQLPDSESLSKQLRLHTDHVLPDRSQQDILFELLLKAGYSLTAPIREIRVADHGAFSISDGNLIICLESPIAIETLRAITALKPKPVQVICLDHAFQGNDQLKTNIVLEMESLGIQFHTV
jgi:adenine-specific DNA-methyltransferase